MAPQLRTVLRSRPTCPTSADTYQPGARLRGSPPRPPHTTSPPASLSDRGVEHLTLEGARARSASACSLLLAHGSVGRARRYRLEGQIFVIRPGGACAIGTAIFSSRVWRRSKTPADNEDQISTYARDVLARGSPCGRCT